MCSGSDTEQVSSYVVTSAADPATWSPPPPPQPAEHLIPLPHRDQDQVSQP